MLRNVLGAMARYWKAFLCTVKESKTLKSELQVASLCLDYVCMGVVILVGLFVSLIGGVGVFASKHPENGCFEFILYGPLIIFFAFYYLNPKKDRTT